MRIWKTSKGTSSKRRFHIKTSTVALMSLIEYKYRQSRIRTLADHDCARLTLLWCPSHHDVHCSCYAASKQTRTITLRNTRDGSIRGFLVRRHYLISLMVSLPSPTLSDTPCILEPEGTHWPGVKSGDCDICEIRGKQSRTEKDCKSACGYAPNIPNFFRAGSSFGWSIGD